jgi:hypothetical protein
MFVCSNFAKNIFQFFTLLSNLRAKDKKPKLAELINSVKLLYKSHLQDNKKRGLTAGLPH